MITFPPPPGLTCARCQRPFNKDLAHWSADGWKHAGACSRLCTMPDCDKPHSAKGLCKTHHTRLRRYGDPQQASRNPLVIEDIEWMVETGEHLYGAVKRTGRTVAALEKGLDRAGRMDLFYKLKHRMVPVAA